MPIKLDWSGWGVDGNLALDIASLDSGEAAHLSPIGGDTSTEATEPVEGKEPGLSEPETESKEAEKVFPLKAQRFKRMDKQILAAVMSAFKESCRRCGLVYCVGQDEQGRPRVVLSGRQGGLALWGLETKLEQEPQLEAALLLELAKTNEELAYILDERAAIRAADGLPDDDMTVAMLTIGLDIDC